MWKLQKLFVEFASFSRLEFQSCVRNYWRALKFFNFFNGHKQLSCSYYINRPRGILSSVEINYFSPITNFEGRSPEILVIVEEVKFISTLDNIPSWSIDFLLMSCAINTDSGSDDAWQYQLYPVLTDLAVYRSNKPRLLSYQ